jgi:predicted RND superfamily exporter protein
MKIKNIFILIIIFILLGTFTISVLANEKSDLTEIEDYIYKIYIKYQEKDYETVYNNMHPEIKEVLEKEKYIKFQKKNTEKYELEISEVEVLKVSRLENIPDTFKDIISDKAKLNVYEISIKYKTNYKNAGNKKEKIIEKETYVVNDNNQNYLLWNPGIINKD